jgi:hypothetical protein
MSNYCYIENGALIYAGHLPKSYKNVSGLDKMNPADLPSVNWFPMEELHPVYDNTTHRRSGTTMEVQADKVVFTDVIIAFTAMELAQNIKNNAQSEIIKLERLQTPRLIREAHLGIVDGRNNRNGVQELKRIEDLIQIERGKL